MNQLYICLLLVVISISSISGQNFSLTFDEIPESNERGLGLYVSANNDIACTSGLVCQNLTVGCTNVYKFNSQGQVEWNRLLSNNRPANWENIFLENDTVFIAGQDFTLNGERLLDEILLNLDSGDSIGLLISKMPDNIVMSNFGQFITNDRIYIYGSATNSNDQFDSPGYIHIMDKEGNYLDHLEYRQDNFNGIFQLMDGPDGDLYFLCESRSSTNDFSDYRLVMWDPMTNETEVIKHISFQASSVIFPFYTMLSDRFIMTKRVYDFTGDFEPLLAMIGLNMDGEMLWQYQIDQENSMDDRLYDIYEMTSCANDDFLICGEFQTGDKNEAGLIMRFNKEGELLWERHYRAYDDFGGQRDCYLEAVREMPDGSIVGIGSMQQVSEFGAEEDFWILKVDANGCYGEGEDCDDLETNQWLTSTEDVVEENILLVHPNPTSGELTVELPEFLSGRLTVRSLTGQVVYIQDVDYTEQIKLDFYRQDAGMYVVEVVSESGERYLEKVVVF